MKELRKYPRFKLKDNSGLATFMLNTQKVQILDISESGICFKFTHRQKNPCKRGDRITVIFRDKNTDSMVKTVMLVMHVEDNATVVGGMIRQGDDSVRKVIEYLQKENLRQYSYNQLFA